MYKVTYFEPTIWMEAEYVDSFETLEEAKKDVKTVLKSHPPKYHGAYIKIEKVELIEMTKLGDKK